MEFWKYDIGIELKRILVFNIPLAYLIQYVTLRRKQSLQRRSSKPCTVSRKTAAIAAAKSLQSCLTLCNPIDGSPPGSPVPGILQARTLEWVAISFSNAWKWKVKVKSLSRVQLLATSWTAAHQAPPSMGFSRQEYWSGVPLPSLSRKATSLETHSSQLPSQLLYLSRLFSFSNKSCIHILRSLLACLNSPLWG